MRLRKKVIIAALSALCAVSLAGCEQKETEDTVKVVYEIGKSTITYGEFYIYARTVEEDYQKTYGKGIWSLELTGENNTSSVKEMTIRDIIADINRVKVMVAQAEEMNIALKENEKKEAEDAASAFYQGLTEANRAEMEITKELVVQVMEENMIAKKVYDQIIAEYDFEISEEEARMTTFYDMVFENYSIKKDGTVKEYTPEKKATQLEKANEALSSLAQDENVTCDTIVERFQLKYSSSYTMSKTEMVEEYGESVAEKILALSDGEVSVVIESDYGYHIFKMIKSNDEELTKKNKEAIITQKQKEYFNGIYAEWQKEYDSKFNFEEDVNMELVNQFPFTENIEDTAKEAADQTSESSGKTNPSGESDTSQADETVGEDEPKTQGDTDAEPEDIIDESGEAVKQEDSAEADEPAE